MVVNFLVGFFVLIVLAMIMCLALHIIDSSNKKNTPPASPRRCRCCNTEIVNNPIFIVILHNHWMGSRGWVKLDKEYTTFEVANLHGLAECALRTDSFNNCSHIVLRVDETSVTLTKK